jgi:phage repressor protein C with HTH and peptisase S24 domain
MLRHADVWSAIDKVARDHGFSLSGLAKRAGLDPSAFNRSKRIGADGRLRFPSLESLVRIFDTTGTNPLDFLAHAGVEPSAGGIGARKKLPSIALFEALARDAFDNAGKPTGNGWDELAFPDLFDDDAYALIVNGDSFEPLYRDGNVLVLSPHAPARRGDRVILRSIVGRLVAREFVRRTPRHVEVLPLIGANEIEAMDAGGVAFIHRIVWASQ